LDLCLYLKKLESTNIAAIKNMDVNEMAEFLEKFRANHCSRCAFEENEMCHEIYPDTGGSCVEGVKEWLKQEHH